MGTRAQQRAQRWLFTLAIVALVVATVSGFLLARNRAEQNADRRAEHAVERAAQSLEDEVRELMSALAGSAAIVDRDGSLDTEVFSVFAGDLLAAGDVPPLSLVSGEAGAAGDRHPVLAVEPDEPGPSAAGRGFGVDPIRRSALRIAAAGHEPVLTDVVELTSSGAPGVELVRPLVERSGASPVVRGFVVAGIPLDRLADRVSSPDRSGAELALVDGETVIFGPEFGPSEPTTTASLSAAGRTWTVVGPAGEPDLTLAWWIVAGGAVAIVTMAALVLTTQRHQRQLARTNALLAQSQERSQAVQEVAGRLARALSGEDVATALVRHLPAAVGARSAVIATLGTDGHLEVLGPPSSADPRRERFSARQYEGSVVETTLIKQRPAWLSSPLGWRGEEVTGALARGGSALALVPLAADDVIGVLAVSYPRIRIFADDEKDLLQTVGLLTARALARGREYDAEHETAVAFQHAALPHGLPAVDGLTIAARYRPATERATVGGDWYDVVVLDERRVVLVVGDVVGHGMVAAAAMGRLRTAFQAIAPLSADPGAMLQAMSLQTDSIPDTFCTTVVCVVLDHETGTMTWSRAGHPPPLVLGQGEPRLLEDRCLPPLGFDPAAPPRVHSRSLDAGDVVVLYTDGIIERRDESIADGFKRLCIVGDNLADLEPEEFSDALVEALVPAEEQADDVAVLVVRYDGPRAEAGPEPTVRAPALGASARRTVQR